MSERSKVVLAVVVLVLLFGGGVGVGVAVDRLWLLPRERAGVTGMLRGPPDMLAGRFTARLDLNEAQSAVVREALGDAYRQVWRLRAEGQPKVERIIEEAQRRISAVLNEAQRAEFRRMLEGRGFGPIPGNRGFPRPPFRRPPFEKAFGKGFDGRPFPPFDGASRTSTTGR